MKKEKLKSEPKGPEKKKRKSSGSKYLLKLFITGTTPNSIRAIENIKEICEKHLQGRYTLEVIDLYKHPGIAKTEQIIAAPTLIKKLPLPLRRIIGDMSASEKVVISLDLTEEGEA